MAKSLPEPGYYRSGDKDVIVLDPATLGDGDLMTKDGDDARWSPAVAFRLAFKPSPTYVLSAAVFDGRFKATTHEDALKRVQAEEIIRDKPEAPAPDETSDGSASAEGVTTAAKAAAESYSEGDE